MTERCLSVEDLAAFADGEVWPDERPRMEAHLARCSKCREIVVSVIRSMEAIPDPVLPKPSEQ